MRLGDAPLDRNLIAISTETSITVVFRRGVISRRGNITEEEGLHQEAVFRQCFYRLESTHTPC